MIVTHEIESESLRETRLAAAVERVIVAHENERESLRETRLAADLERVIVDRQIVRMKVNHCVKRY